MTASDHAQQRLQRFPLPERGRPQMVSGHPRVVRSAGMNDQAPPQVSASPAEAVGTTLDQEKWIAEKAFRDRELILKEREQNRLEDELRLRREEARRSRWSSPLVIAILTAAAAALGNAAIAWQTAQEHQKEQEANNRAQVSLESFKAESARLFEVVKTDDPDKAANNLQFLLDVGLLENPDVKRGVTNYLQNRKTGEGFALPAVSEIVSRPGYSPLFNIKIAASEQISPVDEVAKMMTIIRGYVLLRQQDTIKAALSVWSLQPAFPSYVVSAMKRHGYQSVTLDSKIDLKDRDFLEAFLWAIANVETRSDIPQDVLDKGITQAMNRPTD